VAINPDLSPCTHRNFLVPTTVGEPDPEQLLATGDLQVSLTSITPPQFDHASTCGICTQETYCIDLLRELRPTSAIGQ
jgi:hypothetical protein